jgi:hypothetical protein
MTVNIYVNNILAAAAFQGNMSRLLAPIIEVIFSACGTPDVAVCQCPLSLKKWHELIVGPRLLVLGLVIDTNKMIVGITDEYIQQVWELLQHWDPKWRFFKVSNMQKLVEKLAWLGEGTPWVFKLKSHLYTSLASALKSNTELLEKSSSGFRDLTKQILTKNFFGKQFDLQRHINSAMEKAAKMVNKHNHLYLINPTMQIELNFISYTCSPDSDIRFKTQIAHLIPKLPTALVLGDSLLIACSGYLIRLGFWRHLLSLKEVAKRTLLHVKDNSDK